MPEPVSEARDKAFAFAKLAVWAGRHGLKEEELVLQKALAIAKDAPDTLSIAQELALLGDARKQEAVVLSLDGEDPIEVQKALDESFAYLTLAEWAINHGNLEIVATLEAAAAMPGSVECNQGMRKRLQHLADGGALDPPPASLADNAAAPKKRSSPSKQH